MRHLPLLVCSLVLLGALVHAQLLEPAPAALGVGLDPLTPVERVLALQVARSDPEVQASLAGFRNVAIGASLAYPEVKSSLPAAPALRQAEVQFYRYDPRDVVTALVDLTRQSVVGLTVDIREPVLVVEELVAAKPLLLQDPRVQAALGETQGVELINAGLTAGSPACIDHRCFETRFVRPAGANAVNLEPVPFTIARFNLSTMTVDDVYSEA